MQATNKGTVISLHQQKINADKILTIHNNMPVMLVGNLLGSIPLIIMFWLEGYRTSVIIWSTSIYLFTFVRWLHYRSLKNIQASCVRIFSQGRGYFFFSLFSGCIWGSIGIVFFNAEALTTFTFMIVALASFVSGSMASMSARPFYYFAFAIPASAPIITNMLLQNQAFYTLLGIAALIFLGTTFIFSRNLHHVINSSLILKYENIDLVKNLKEQTEKAHKASKDKSRFIAVASHDLRQPLHAVNLFVETLENKLSTKEQKRDLNYIRYGLDSLGELFNALLDISQLDSEVIQINKINFEIDDLLQKLSSQFLPDAKSKQLCLTMQKCHKVVYSDPVLLEQLISNLLSNAIRYTPHGKIEIFFTHDDDIVYLHIKDTGIGIPEKERENVFSEFFQIHNPERNRNKGLGLGLAIVRRVSDLLNIPVELHSQPDTGTEFILALSIGQSHDKNITIQSTTQIKNKLENLNVMVIDNEATILYAMKNLLESWQCRFIGADSTEKALDHINNGEHPQFILADYRMPGYVNGCELVKIIQQKTGKVPALIITGETCKEVLTEIQEANLMMLNKPAKPAQLRLAMMRLLKN